jgi:hypothetical protein
MAFVIEPKSVFMRKVIDINIIIIINTVKPVQNGISRDQKIFPLKPGFRLIKVYYILYCN